MHKKTILKGLILLFFTPLASFASDVNKSGDPQSKAKYIKEYIQHHLKDTYDFDFFSTTDQDGYVTHWGFPLPVILWDDGLKVFLSSEFHHGKTVAEVDGNYYKIDHGKIYKTDAIGSIKYDEVNHVKNIGEKHYKRYMSFLLTIFFFIWIVNLFGLTPLGVNITNNIAITFFLALLTYLITTFTAKKDYWKHIFWMPGVPVPMKFILAPIELLGTFIKPFSLMIRLYANITAGHIVLMSLIGMMFIFKNWSGTPLSFILAFVLSLLELLVAALQAYIFTMLSALYFGVAVEEHDHH